MSEIDLSRIDDLAPDPATLERAYALARPKKWQQLGQGQSDCWGVFPTRGALSYRTAISLAGKAHYCNCASRAYPCKHILALLLLRRNHPDSLTAGKAPEWLELWKKRAARDPSEAEKREALEKRGEQIAKARDERLLSMRTGASDLVQWMSDLLGQGLAMAAAQPAAFWEEMAARMVDAKLGAIARRIRSWPEWLAWPEGHELVFREMGSEYLLAQALSRLEELPHELQQSALARAGVTLKKEEILARPPQRDKWLVAGLERGENNSLFFRRTWLLGSGSGKAALLLDFAHGQPEFQDAWPTGMAIEADMHYYPGNFPVRARIGTYQPSDGSIGLPPGTANARSMLEQFAAALALDPWLEEMPFFLHNMQALRQKKEWKLMDSLKDLLPMEANERALWELIALSAREPVSVFGTWNGAFFKPLSAVASARLIALSQEQK